jgi:hypothetical protein
VHLPADALPVRVVACRRQHDPHRLTAGIARAERHNVPQSAVRLRVQLVEDHAARLVAVLAVGFTGQHLHLRAAHRVENGLFAVDDAAALFERGRVLDHVRRRREHNVRVVAVRRHEVDLAVGLPVREQVIRAEPGRDLALAVLLRDFEIEILVLAQILARRVLVLGHFAVKRLHHVALPVDQPQRHAARARQAFEIVAHKIRLLPVKHRAASFRLSTSCTALSTPAQYLVDKAKKKSRHLTPLSGLKMSAWRLAGLWLALRKRSGHWFCAAFLQRFVSGAPAGGAPVP